MRLLLLIFAGLMLFTACTDSQPDTLVPEDIYESIFIELAIIDQLEEVLLGGHTRRELRQKVYQHYGVTAEDFAISHEYYEQNIDEQIQRIERINERLRDERSAIDESERQFRDQNRRSAESLREQIFNRPQTVTEDDQPINGSPGTPVEESEESPVMGQVDSTAVPDFGVVQFDPDGQFTVQVQVQTKLNRVDAEVKINEWIERGFEHASLKEVQHENTDETRYTIVLGNLNSLQEAEALQEIILEVIDVDLRITSRDEN
ncbi:MAG: DUF4296 domain-containing protein [Balneolaceae bacterium]|nr:DUF4296 domain-containing protein [Balneolaceae bacterium]